MGALETRASDPSSLRGARDLDAPTGRNDSLVAMSDYRIEKVRRRVELSLVNRVELRGDIFLQAAGRYGAGPEEPVDALNGDAPFIPLVQSPGDVTVVQKSHIFTLSTGLPERDDAIDRGA